MNGEWFSLLSAIVAAVAAPIGAWLGSRLMRAKYLAEVEGLRAELQGKVAEARASELDNVRKASDILMDSIVPPLKMEIINLRNDVQRLNQALERIWACAHVEHCPVRRDLMRRPQKDALVGKRAEAGAGVDDAEGVVRLGRMARDNLDGVADSAVAN